MSQSYLADMKAPFDTCTKQWKGKKTGTQSDKNEDQCPHNTTEPFYSVKYKVLEDKKGMSEFGVFNLWKTKLSFAGQSET